MGLPGCRRSPTSDSVLIRVTTAVMKPHDQSSFGREGFIWLTRTHHCSPSLDVRAGTQTGRNLEAGADADFKEECCLLACSSWFAPIEPRTINLGMAPPTVGFTFHHASIIKKMFYRLANSPVLWRCFLNWVSLFSSDSSLCQVAIELSSTTMEMRIMFSNSVAHHIQLEMPHIGERMSPFVTYMTFPHRHSILFFRDYCRLKLHLETSTD